MNQNYDKIRGKRGDHTVSTQKVWQLLPWWGVQQIFDEQLLHSVVTEALGGQDFVSLWYLTPFESSPDMSKVDWSLLV